MPNIFEILRRFFLRMRIKKEVKEPVRTIKKRVMPRHVKKIKHPRIKHIRKYKKIKIKFKKYPEIKKIKIKPVKKRHPKIKKLKIQKKVQQLLEVQEKKIKQIKPKLIFTLPKIEPKRIKLFKFPKFRLTLPKIKKLRIPKLKPPVLPKPTKIGKVKKVPQPKIPKELIKEAIAADVMSKSVYSVRPNDTLNYVVRLFADKKISGAPVVKGNNLVGIIGESDIVKLIGSKEMLSDRGLGLKTLSELTVEEVMHKNPVFVYEYTKLSEATDLMNKYDITRLPVLNERRELTGILARSDIMRGISKELLLKILEKREIERILKVETDIDEILQIVERRGSIGVGEIRKKLMIPEDKIEEWGKILEQHNLIEMFYPPIGKPEFRKKVT